MDQVDLDFMAVASIVTDPLYLELMHPMDMFPPINHASNRDGEREQEHHASTSLLLQLSCNTDSAELSPPTLTRENALLLAVVCCIDRYTGGSPTTFVYLTTSHRSSSLDHPHGRILRTTAAFASDPTRTIQDALSALAMDEMPLTTRPTEAPFVVIFRPDHTDQPAPISSPLTLRFLERSEISHAPELRADFDYTLLSLAFVNRLLRHISHVMLGLVCKPVDAALRACVNDLWCEERTPRDIQTGASPVRHSTRLEDCVARWCQRDPLASAVFAWDGELSRKQLDAASNQLASQLSAAGLNQGLLGILMDKSLWIPVTLLAVLKARCSFVLLDTKLPPRRLCQITDLCSLRGMIASRPHTELATRLAGHVLSLNGDGNLMAVGSKCGLPTSGLLDQDQAFVIFTSGSSGAPKAVSISHTAWASNYLEGAHTYHLSERRRVMQNSSFSFIVAMIEMLSTLMIGGTICMPSQHEKEDDLNGALNRLRADWLTITPSAARMLDVSITLTLKTVMLVGEISPISLVRTLRAAGITVFNGYGQTEACGQISSFNLTYDEADPHTIGTSTTIGRSKVVYPYNHNLSTPLGGVGELVLESYSLGQYVFDPTRTSQCAISETRSTCAKSMGRIGQGLRTHMTGDLVSYQDDGRLLYIGRKDSLFKIRGQRVMAAEVQHHILDEFKEELQDVLVDVLTSSDPRHPHRLAFFAVLKDHIKERALAAQGADQWTGTCSKCGQITALRSYAEDLARRCLELLHSTLPTWMVPTHSFLLEALPTTASGKHDRKRLQNLTECIHHEPFETRASKSFVFQSHVQPATLHLLLKLCHDTFGMQPINVSHDIKLLELGFDSISSIMFVQAAIRMGVRISAKEVMQMHTFDQLATFVQQRISTFPAATMVKLTQQADSTSKSSFPLTSFQSFTIRMNQSCHAALIYNFNLTVRGRVNAGRLRAATDELLGNNDAFHLRFNCTGVGDARQTANKHEPPKVVVMDATKFSASSVPPSMSCPVQAVLIADAGNVVSLRLRLHHAIFDGHSIALFWQDLAETYAQQHNSTKRRPQWIPYLTKVLLQRMEDSLHYWRELLRGSSLTVLRVPVQHLVDDDSPVVDMTTHRTVLLPAATETLVNFNQVTLVQLAWAMLLSHVSGKTDVIFLHILHGRQESYPESASIIGCCATEIPVRVQINMNFLPSVACQQIQDQVYASAVHAHLGSGMISSKCTEWPRKDELYRHSTFLQYQNIDDKKHIPLGQDGYGDIECNTAESGIYDLVLFVRPFGRTLDVSLQSTSEFYTLSELTAVADSFSLLLTLLHSKCHEDLDAIATHAFAESGLEKGCFSLKRQTRQQRW